MSANLKLVKLDGRHAGYGVWKYYIERPATFPSSNSKQIFFQWRSWCWEQWGPSKELNEYDIKDLFDGVHCSNEHWCWMNDEHGRSRIYFKNDESASMFTLQWL